MSIKMVNGIAVELTAEEQAEFDAAASLLPAQTTAIGAEAARIEGINAESKISAIYTTLSTATAQQISDWTDNADPAQLKTAIKFLLLHTAKTLR